VIAGADRGTKSRVIQVDRVKKKALVEGVSRVYKHVKRSQKHPQGGRLSKEMPVQISNLQYVCWRRSQRTFLQEVWSECRRDLPVQSCLRNKEEAFLEGVSLGAWKGLSDQVVLGQ